MDLAFPNLFDLNTNIKQCSSHLYTSTKLSTVCIGIFNDDITEENLKIFKLALIIWKLSSIENGVTKLDWKRKEKAERSFSPVEGFHFRDE